MSFLVNIKTPQDLELEKQISIKQLRKQELERLLSKTDHKAMPDYEPKQGEDLDLVLKNRKSYREEVREIIRWLDSVK